MRRSPFAFAVLASPLVVLGACLSSEGASPAPVDGIDAATPGVDSSTSHVDAAKSDAADASAPDTSVADVNLPDTNVSDTSLPDTNVADTNAADTNAPDTSVADTSVADANDAGTIDSGAPVIGVRFAHLVPDLGGAVDFCVAPQGGAYGAPHMKSVGVNAGVAYGQVSERALLAPSSIQIRVVPAGSTCATPLAGVIDLENVNVTTGSATTIAFVGLAADGGGKAMALIDYGDSPSTSNVRTRMIHAAPNEAPVDVQLGAGDFVMDQQVGVAYQDSTTDATQATNGDAVDGEGYMDPQVGAQYVAHRGGTVVGTFWNDGNQGTTAFFVGVAGSATAPLGFVVLDENGPVTGHLSHTFAGGATPDAFAARLLDLAPDFGAMEVCLAISKASASFVGPLLAAAGVNGGMTVRQLSGVVAQVPAYTDMDVRFVVPGQGCGDSSRTSGFTVGGGYTEMLLAPTQRAFGAGATYSIGLVSTSFAASSGQASLVVSNQVYEPSGESVDVFDTPNGGAEAALATGVPATQDQGSVDALAAGTYTLRVANSATSATLLTKPNVTFASGQRLALVWFHAAAGAAGGSLARCDLLNLGAGQMGACGQ